MARVSALGGWLKDSKGKDKQRRVSASVEREKVNIELFIWRIRGCLWAGTNNNRICFYASLATTPTIRLVDSKAHLHPTASFSDSRSRSSTPFPIPSFGGRSSSQASARSTPTPADSDLLASLSLSSKPVITPTNPIFGLPSLLSSTSGATSQKDAHDVDAMEDDDFYAKDDMAMDWTPIHPSHTHQSDSRASRYKDKQKAAVDDDDGSWLRPQRFFAPEKPTGLEGLFERAKLVDDDANKSKPTHSTHICIPKWMYALSVVPIVLAFLAWKLWRGKPQIEYSLPYPSYS
ncbi:Integral inner nuclear membrane protein [Salix suchowensis]|nr:Integral inner nuclear membrane protein [Salix suchowensis]